MRPATSSPRFGARCLAGLAASLLCAASSAIADTDLDPAKFMTVDEIRPGMHGTGVSVFSGRGRQSFDVEVIDVLRQHGPRRNLILAELTGDVVSEAGIIAGMSGSPVYIDDRLIGAVAYGWSFAKRPIAGITPIEEMLEVMRMPDPPEPPVSAGLEYDRPMPPDLADAGLPGAPAVGAGSRRSVSSRYGDLVPLRMPLVVSGVAEPGVDMLASFFSPLGVDVVQGVGGSVSAEGAATTMGPGDPVAIPLVRGDASIAVFGTITYSDGDRLVAFGHPVFHTGGQRLPMAGGHVVGVLPSQLQSFKFSSAAEPVGYIFSDQTPGAVGRIGEPPSMLPVSLVIDGPTGEQAFAYEVVRDRFLTVPMIQALASNTMTSRIYRSGMGTLRTDVTVTLADGQVIQHRDVLATINPPDNVGVMAASPVSMLLNNPFVEPSIEKVDLRVTLDQDVDIVMIEEVSVNDPWVPGQIGRVYVRMRAYRGDMIERVIELPVPESMPEGSALVKVCDRVSLDAWDRERAPDKYRARNLRQFVKSIQEQPAHNELEARLFAAGAALVVQGHEMPDLPPSVAATLARTSSSGDRAFADGVEMASVVLSLDQHVVGCHTLSVEVEKR